MRIKKSEHLKDTTLLFFKKEGLQPETLAARQELSTLPGLNLAAGCGKLMNVPYSKEHPADAFTAVKYRDYWYWVDDRDFRTKRTFAFMMILFSLTETGGKEGLPLVTIPAG